MNIKTEESEAQNWNKKGKALRAIGKYKKAIACYDKAIKLEPRYTAALYNKGNALLALGMYRRKLSVAMIK